MAFNRKIPTPDQLISTLTQSDEIVVDKVLASIILDLEQRWSEGATVSVSYAGSVRPQAVRKIGQALAKAGWYVETREHDDQRDGNFTVFHVKASEKGSGDPF